MTLFYILPTHPFIPSHTILPSSYILTYHPRIPSHHLSVAEPSGQPTCQPSQQPSMQPTTEPTSNPSFVAAFWGEILGHALHQKYHRNNRGGQGPGTCPNNCSHHGIVTRPLPTNLLHCSIVPVFQTFPILPHMVYHIYLSIITTNHVGACHTNVNCVCSLSSQGDPLWYGADCSLRACPHDTAWVGYVVNANDLHPRMECSNKGTKPVNAG